MAASVFWCRQADLDRLVAGGLALIGLATVGFAATFSMPRGSAANPDTGEAFTCTVTGVHDGDGPIYCAEGPKVRLSAIAARELDETCEPGHPCPSASGAAARAELTRLASGQALSCEATGKSYGRVTAWCWRRDGTQLNCAMLESGTVEPWLRFDPQGRMCS